MSIFDRIISRTKVPKGYAEVNVTFTEEESEAIRTGMDEFAVIANLNAPEGSESWVHPKAHEALKAKTLVEYVENLVLRLEHCDQEEAGIILDKAIKAQLKAYAMHNLPVYLFQAAGLFEMAGKPEDAKKFFGLFLRAEAEFQPNKIDQIMLRQAGFDMEKVIALAKEKA